MEKVPVNGVVCGSKVCEEKRDPVPMTGFSYGLRNIRISRRCESFPNIR